MNIDIGVTKQQLLYYIFLIIYEKRNKYYMNESMHSQKITSILHSKLK